MPRGATEQGEEIFRTWQVYVVLAAIVAGIVYGLIVWSVIRYGRRRAAEAGALPPQFRANVPLEILYTGIPILIVIGLFAASLAAEGRVNRLTDTPAAILRAEAFAWGWRFVYEGEAVTVASEPGTEPEIALPLGETTRVELTSNDVIHAFYVPEFLFKRDAVPGRTTAFDLTPTRLGTFRGACAEFCGLNHAFMGFAVRVLPPGEFEAWLGERRESGA
jgi:cytochrome c oxidase subunit 2